MSYNSRFRKSWQDLSNCYAMISTPHFIFRTWLWLSDWKIWGLSMEKNFLVVFG
uniref:Uncharacterized protein n=1 Tax=Rhizophora mucronata TaxID=61149 RepID=A0A2P2NZE1_RHIMU